MRAAGLASALPMPDRYVLAADAIVLRDGVLEHGAMAVDHGVIAFVGLLQALPEPLADWPVFDLGGCVVMPGIIDAHHHVIEPFAKALTCGEPAQMWKRIWMPLEAVATEESCFNGAKWTFMEALRGGVTTIVEHAVRSEAFAEAVHAAAQETGIRLVSSVGGYDLKNFSGGSVSGSAAPSTSSSVDDVLRLAERHIANCKAYDRVYPSVACGTVQSNSPDMVRALAAFSRDRRILFQIHANEHTGEIQSCLEAYAKRPIEFLHSLDALGPTTLIAHATLVTPGEIEALVSTDTAVSYNPVAALWKGNNVAPALQYIERGIRVALGSDATRNDGLRLMDAAESCQRLAYGMPNDDFSCGAGWRWVHAATAGGAAAIGLGEVTGALEVGKAADFLVLDRTQPEVLPSWDLLWELVRFYDRADIVATFVDGRLLVHDGKTTRFDGDRFIAEALPKGIAEIAAAGITRLHGPSSAHRKPHAR
jgi:cytosine/adenosine deaminase-related metal-dependent hydrolase